MAHQKAWTEDDIAKLKNLAGQVKAAQIADQLGRSQGATMVQASKLGISLRHRLRDKRTNAANGQVTQDGPT